MCGAGTIPIEGAMLARRMAPGIDYVRGVPRAFAFTQWSDHDASEWRSRVQQAVEVAAARASAPIAAADRDAGAVLSARTNAERAGVIDDLTVEQQPISALQMPPVTGHIVTNPPYGVRVGDRLPLRNLYAQLGKVVRARAAGWTIALLSADRALERHTGLALSEVFHTSNGGIAVRLVRGRV
jgi:putative N6-adenine-specific DNA methylase